MTSNGDSRFRCLVESTSDGYLAYDGDGRLLDVNQSACEVSGHERDSLLAMVLSRPLPPGELDLRQDHP